MVVRPLSNLAVLYLHNSRTTHADWDFSTRLRERLVFASGKEPFANDSILAAKNNVVAELQKYMHNALREQHPDWIEPNGDCSAYDLYEKRFADLLTLFAENGANCSTAPPMFNGFFVQAMDANHFSLRNVLLHLQPQTARTGT